MAWLQLIKNILIRLDDNTYFFESKQTKCVFNELSSIFIGCYDILKQYQCNIYVNGDNCDDPQAKVGCKKSCDRCEGNFTVNMSY